VKLENSDVLQTFQGDSKWINGISFSEDDKTIALACSDKTVKLWSLESIEVKTLKAWDMFDGKELRFPRKQSEQSNIHPDGQTLAEASHDGTVKLRNRQDGKEMHTFETNCSRVSSVSFSSDGKTLTFTSIDGREIQWNLDLEDLLKRGCNWLHDYLKTNPNVSESDKLLCDGIGTQK
jgi:WD40 repeat protein